MTVLRMRPWTKGKVFLVWRPDWSETEEDAREVEASDAETAAEDRAEEHDSGGDYDIVGGSDAIYHVMPKDDPAAPVEVYTVTGETVPQYSATKRESPDPSPAAIADVRAALPEGETCTDEEAREFLSARGAVCGEGEPF